MPTPANYDSLQAAYEEFLVRRRFNNSVEIAMLLLLQSRATRLIFDNTVRKWLGRNADPEEFVGEIFEILAFKTNWLGYQHRSLSCFASFLFKVGDRAVAKIVKREKKYRAESLFDSDTTVFDSSNTDDPKRQDETLQDLMRFIWCNTQGKQRNVLFVHCVTADVHATASIIGVKPDTVRKYICNAKPVFDRWLEQ